MWTLFRTYDNCYIYNRNGNILRRISRQDYEALKSNKEAHQLILSRINMEEKDRIEAIEHPSLGYLEDLLNRKVEQVVLQVTQRCNLACEYCTYSGKYYNREHSGAEMSWDIAKKCVDFGIRHSIDSERLTIGFYGGEPLLNFSLIKKVVLYARDVYPEKKIHFSITCNGTLLSEDVLSFLEKHNFTLMVSLDGPADMHDRYRRFVGGQGSHNIVACNLKMNQQAHRCYIPRVSTNSVLQPDANIYELTNYLACSEEAAVYKSKISVISDSGMDQRVSYNPEVDAYVEKEQLLQLLRMLKRVTVDANIDHFGDISSKLIQKYKVLQHTMNHSGRSHPGGPCVMGLKRTFFDVNGNILPCEKVPERKEFYIGSVEAGYDIAQISRWMNIGEDSRDECMNCWAYHFCTNCLASSVNSKGYSVNKKLSACNSIRYNAIKTLMQIAVLIENGFDFEEEVQRRYFLSKGAK